MADTPQASATSSIEDQIRLREQKAQQLREKGSHPYGNGVTVPHTTGFVRMRHADDDAAALEQDQSEPYGVAGRGGALRRQGEGGLPHPRGPARGPPNFLQKGKGGGRPDAKRQTTGHGGHRFSPR